LGEVFGGNGSIFIGDMNGLVGGFVGVDPDVALMNVALFIYPLFKFVGVALAVDVSVDLVDVFILIRAGLCFMGFVVLGPRVGGLSDISVAFSGGIVGGVDVVGV
jgi:hypothetical protein